MTHVFLINYNMGTILGGIVFFIMGGIFGILIISIVSPNHK